MDLISDFKEQARSACMRVILPESKDERILDAARQIADEGWAEPVILGEECPGAGVDCISAKDEERLGRYKEIYLQGRPNVPEKVAARLVKKSLIFSGAAVAAGDADCLVAGAANATANVITSAQLTVGLAEGISVPSSFFLMEFPDLMGQGRQILVYADCAVNIQPSAQELADIALASAASAEALLGVTPRVAMLSFSTKGSGPHGDSEKVVEATEIVRQKAPDLLVDGELQADSAIVQRVADKKCPGSEVAGKANVLVFPDLDAGNIGYKLSQYVGNARAYGPILQGFRKPCSDLSRGATVEDIVGASAIVAAIAAGKSK